METKTQQSAKCPKCGSSSVCNYNNFIVNDERVYVCLNCDARFHQPLNGNPAYLLKRGIDYDLPPCKIPSSTTNFSLKRGPSSIPTQPRTETSDVVKGLIALIFIVFVVIAYFVPQNSTDFDNTNPYEDIDSDVKNSWLDASVWQVERYLKNSLHDPESYKSVEWSKVEISHSAGYKYYVRHKYRAKNQYGAYTMENKIFYIDSKGNVVGMKDYEDY